MFVVIWRTVFLYIFIVIGLRFMGKRQLGELQPSELVVTILISNIASIPIENLDASLLGGLMSISLLICLELISAGLALKSRKMRNIIQGSPATIIRDGVIDQNKMEQLRYSLDDLMEQLRNGSVFNVDDVLTAVIETTGSLSIYPKAPNRPITPNDMQMPVSETPPYFMVIGDGEICLDGIKESNIDEDWVLKTIKKKGYEPEEVYLMVANSKKDYKLVPKNLNVNRKGKSQ